MKSSITLRTVGGKPQTAEVDTREEAAWVIKFMARLGISVEMEVSSKLIGVPLKSQKKNALNSKNGPRLKVKKQKDDDISDK
jgi:hypothetical protein